MERPMPDIVLGVPASVQDLIQKGLIERAFHEGLFPKLLFAMEAQFEKWEEHMGVEVFQSRPGLLRPKVKPQAPGTDPSPQVVPYEQWSVVIQQFADSIDTHTPTSAVQAQNQFLSNINQLGLQAGQSKNRLSRNALYKPYVSGQTVLKVAALVAATTISVSSMNGFLDVITTSTSARPNPVNPTTPLIATIGTGVTKETISIVGAVPDSALDPDGPGTLFLAVGLVSAQAIRAPVKSAKAPRLTRPSAGESVDAITAGDTLVLQQLINSVGLLERANVPKHADGFFHCHLSPMSQTQLFADPVFQRLNQSLPDSVTYREGLLGELYGVLFYKNNECPDDTNTFDVLGALTTSTTIALVDAKYSTDIGAEVINGSGVKIARSIITGRNPLVEKGLDESAYLTEAGIVGKIGEFDIKSGGAQVNTQRIRLIMRAPLDRLQQFVSCTWSFTLGFAAPSDLTAPSGPERFKRAVVMEHAAG